MIQTPRRASETQIPLKSDRGPLNLVKDALPRHRNPGEEHIVEEGRDGVVGDVGGRELLAGVLGATVGDAEVAVGGGEDVGVGLRVDAHGEGEGDAAVAVVFVVVGWVAEVAGGRSGENEVRGRTAG